jgi:hypothetical protein
MATLNTWVMVLIMNSFSNNKETVIVKEFATKVECELKAAMYIRYNSDKYIEYTCQRSGQ